MLAAGGDRSVLSPGAYRLFRIRKTVCAMLHKRCAPASRLWSASAVSDVSQPYSDAFLWTDDRTVSADDS